MRPTRAHAIAQAVAQRRVAAVHADHRGADQRGVEEQRDEVATHVEDERAEYGAGVDPRAAAAKPPSAATGTARLQRSAAARTPTDGQQQQFLVRTNHGPGRLCELEAACKSTGHVIPSFRQVSDVPRLIRRRAARPSQLGVFSSRPFCLVDRVPRGVLGDLGAAPRSSPRRACRPAGRGRAARRRSPPQRQHASPPQVPGLLVREPLEWLEEFGRLDGQRGGEVAGRVELVPIAVCGEGAQFIAQPGRVHQSQRRPPLQWPPIIQRVVSGWGATPAAATGRCPPVAHRPSAGGAWSGSRTRAGGACSPAPTWSSDPSRRSRTAHDGDNGQLSRRVQAIELYRSSCVPFFPPAGSQDRPPGSEEDATPKLLRRNINSAQFA